MNLFKSSFFSDFKLTDVLAFKEEDHPSSSQHVEPLISPDAEDMAWHDVKSLPNSSSNAKVVADGSEEAIVSSDEGTVAQEEENAGIWGLGGLMKSITLKSEGILQSYRKDLEEFGKGLKKETEMFAEVAVHAVKDLPTSLETGAFLAQESIESVGQVVEDFSSSVWRGTADLIAQGKEAVLRIDEDESFAPTSAASSASPSLSRYDNVPIGISSGKYSRFEAQVRAMQHDSSTYCDEPGDLADYMAWKSTFSLPDRKHNIETLLAENAFLQELLLRFVPEVVSEETFWTRYFYRFHKLEQTEEARADLVKRATALEEEDLSWDTEEEFEEGGIVQDEEAKAMEAEVVQKVGDRSLSEERVQASDSKREPDNDVVTDAALQVHVDNHSGSEGPSKTLAEEEEDLGWEVAEDVESSSNDGKRSSNSEASWEVPDVPRADRRKQFAAQEDDEEDLSWDVDDGVDETK